MNCFCRLVFFWWFMWAYSPTDVATFLDKIAHPETAKITVMQNAGDPSNKIWCVFYDQQHPIVLMSEELSGLSK